MAEYNHEKGNITEEVKNKLAEKMIGLFDLVIADRSNYFANNPDKIPDKKSIPAIIKSYATINAAISGGANLIPGPWGMIAVIPEIIAVIRNQLAMIYEIGMAYGKSKTLTRELLAGILITALGSGAGTLLIMQGSKVLVKRVALRQFQAAVAILAGKITQQLLKSTISRWLPIIGAAAMATWSNYLTRRVGNKAIEIFEKEIVLTDDDNIEEIIQDFEFTSDPVEDASYSVEDVRTNLDIPKVQTLISLMKVDGIIKPQELEYVQDIINNADLTEDERINLTQTIDRNEKFSIDYSGFANSPDDAVGLLVDMVTLAKRDGAFHITEKMFVKQVGKLLGFSTDDIEESMEIIV